MPKPFSERKGRVRLSRAGNDLDAFPFEKLSVDGAKLAQSIISPLESPAVAMMRAKDPLDLDRTDETVESSSGNESTSSDEKPTLHTRVGDQSDQYYTVEESPSVRRFSSPPVKSTKSLEKYTSKKSPLVQRRGSTDPDAEHATSNSRDEDDSDYDYEVEPSTSVRKYASPPAKHTNSVTHSQQFAKSPGDSNKMGDLPEVMPSVTSLSCDSPGAAAAYGVDIGSPSAAAAYGVTAASPGIHRVVSPPAKGSTSVTFSTKFVKDPNYDYSLSTTQANSSSESSSSRMVDLPDHLPNGRPRESLSSHVMDSTVMDSTANTEYTEVTLTSVSSPGVLSKASVNSRGSIEPEAHHIRNVKGSTHCNDLLLKSPDSRPSDESESEDSYSNDSQRFLTSPNPSAESTYTDDSFYEVYESPQATTGHSRRVVSTSIGNMQDNKGSEHYYRSDAESSTGWESGMSFTEHTKKSDYAQSPIRRGTRPVSESTFSSEPLSDVPMTATAETSTTGSNTPSFFASLSTFSNMPFTPSDRTRQNKSPAASKKHREELSNSPVDIPLGFNEFAGGMDPDGADPGDNRSTTGEDLVPTPDDTNAYTAGYYNSESFNTGGRSSVPSRSTPSNDNDGNSSNAAYVEESDEESSDEDESSDDDESDGTPVIGSSPSATNIKEPKSSPFPSYRLLICMVVVIVLLLLGLIAGLTYYLWDQERLDPVRPPNADPRDDPIDPSATPVDNIPPTEIFIPNNKRLKKLFATVVNKDDIDNDETAAGMAANWMLNEDPGKDLKQRSDDAWIQRYILVYTYFATTMNGETLWLSCNPPTGASLSTELERKDEDLEPLSDSDACRFAYPTELPGGKIIYDMVPSYRWLSGTDECQWGGVACSKTVTDEIKTDTKTFKMNRLAVTSITLADQYLTGAIVTELTNLPELQLLDLSHNGLTGTLSEDFRSLETLRLQYNNVEGKIPSNFFDDQSVMKELNIGSNSMTGTIPDLVGLASKMESLYLFENMFQGSIPNLGFMPLQHFQVQKNKFTGMLPFDQGMGGPWPDTLTEWWSYDNELSGSLSENLGFLKSLEDLRIGGNRFTGKIPASITDLDRLFRFDAHYNELTGTVPEGIGDLPNLRDVRLQFNNLDGVIPTSLCFLESMEVLDADCLGFDQFGVEIEPKTDCFCCTTCCNPSIFKCETY